MFNIKHYDIAFPEITALLGCCKYYKVNSTTETILVYLNPLHCIIVFTQNAELKQICV